MNGGQLSSSGAPGYNMAPLLQQQQQFMPIQGASPTPQSMAVAIAAPITLPPMQPVGQPQPPASSSSNPADLVARPSTLAPGGPTGSQQSLKPLGEAGGTPAAPLFVMPRRPNHGIEGRPIVLRANHFQVAWEDYFLENHRSASPAARSTITK